MVRRTFRSISTKANKSPVNVVARKSSREMFRSHTPQHAPFRIPRGMFKRAKPWFCFVTTADSTENWHRKRLASSCCLELERFFSTAYVLAKTSFITARIRPGLCTRAHSILNLLHNYKYQHQPLTTSCAMSSPITDADDREKAE